MMLAVVSSPQDLKGKNIKRFLQLFVCLCIKSNNAQDCRRRERISSKSIYVFQSMIYIHSILSTEFPHSSHYEIDNFSLHCTLDGMI